MTTQPITTRLREATKDLHTEAEQHPVQKRLVQGKLPREGYAAWLGQMLRMHEAFEPELDRLAHANPAFARVLARYCAKTPLIGEDLAFLGVGPDGVQPTPAATRFARFAQELADKTPFALFGVGYVFEGATNGGKYLVRAASAAYRFADSQGTRYLDPYGDEQGACWAAFGRGMDQAGFTPAQARRIVEVACATFRGIIGVFDDLAEGSGARDDVEDAAVPA